MAGQDRCADCGTPDPRFWSPRQKLSRCGPCNTRFWDLSPHRLCDQCGGEGHDGYSPCLTCRGEGLVLKDGFTEFTIAVSDDEAAALADFTYRVGDLEPLNQLIHRITTTTEAP